jgi:hypothetical protein
MFTIGQKVQRDFGGPIMEVVGLEPDLIENVLTQWEDEDGNIITAKLMEAELRPAGDIQNSES